MATYQTYIIVGVLLIGLEIFVPGFVLAPLGIASLLTAGVAAFTDSAVAQLATFSASALLIFFGLKYWYVGRSVAGAASSEFGLVGKVGTLVEPCVSPLQPGRVRVFADTWEVYWDDRDPALEGIKACPPGTRMEVIAVVGNRVSVKPVGPANIH